MESWCENGKLKTAGVDGSPSHILILNLAVCAAHRLTARCWKDGEIILVAYYESFFPSVEDLIPVIKRARFFPMFGVHAFFEQSECPPQEGVYQEFHFIIYLAY